MSPYDEGRLARTFTNVDEALFLRSYGYSWHEIAKRVGVKNVLVLARSLDRRGYHTFAREAKSESTWSASRNEHWSWEKQGRLAPVAR